MNSLEETMDQIQTKMREHCDAFAKQWREDQGILYTIETISVKVTEVFGNETLFNALMIPLTLVGITDFVLMCFIAEEKRYPEQGFVKVQLEVP